MEKIKEMKKINMMFTMKKITKVTVILKIIATTVKKVKKSPEKDIIIIHLKAKIITI